MTATELAVLICQSLEVSRSVEVEGLGVFSRDAQGKVTFREPGWPRVFIAYALEDRLTAERLCDDLLEREYEPWMDVRRLLPGQNWPRRIQEAIEGADFFIACFSSQSVGKRGGFQAEVRYALDCARRVPLDDVFLIPVRLDGCRVPARIMGETQYVDLFPDWGAGVERIVRVMERQRRRPN
jgi:hypothetical protein